MEHTKQLALARRSLVHIANRTTDRDENPTTVPVAAYLDHERYAREVDVLFRRAPVIVGHVSQLANPGDFITHDSTGVPLLVVRGDDGSLGAFLNVCRHRGTRLENEPCGRGKRGFVCPYHAWSYARDGHLIAIPHDNGFPGIQRDTRGLVRVPVGEAAGLVWVIATPASSPEELKLDASAILGEMEDDLVRFGVPTSQVYKPRSSDREMNWKLSIDIFLETYHLRPTHRNTIYPLFFDNLGLVDRIGPHLRTVLPKRTIRGIANESEEILGSTLREHANIVYFVFPNTIVLILGDHVTVTSMWPVGIGRTRFVKYMLLPELPQDEKAVAHWELNDTILVTATDEDLVLGESIQKGLASGANEEVVFGAFEHALAHFHAQIEKRLNSARAQT
jgi:phenylpropionate dioxygenase-like ring-hydroxylating dioxygenase large terminal subunit